MKEPNAFDSSFASQTDVESATFKHRKRSKLILLVVIAVVILAGLASFGAYQWLQYKKDVERIAATRKQLTTIVIEDNALVQELMDIGNSSNITSEEFLKRSKTNREQRDDLMKRMRTIEAGPYAQQTQQFIQLMGIENDFVRSTETAWNERMDSIKSGMLMEAAFDARKKAQDDLAALAKYLLSASDDELLADEPLYNEAKAAAYQTSEKAKQAMQSYQALADEEKESDNDVASVAQKWIGVEHQWYPDFAPSRNILDELIKQKNEYQAEASSHKNDNKNSNKVKSDASTKL